MTSKVAKAMEKKRIPKRRFREFLEAGEWGCNKASNVFESISDKNHAELPVLSATQDKGMVLRDTNGINIQHDEKSELTYKRVLPGQFVIHLRSFQGGFAHSSVEGITSPAYTVMDFKNNEHNDYFWKYIFMSEEFIKRLETVTYGIRDGRSISYDDFSTMSFVFPNKSEQAKIGNFCRRLDTLISLHQQKLSKLKEMKQAYLTEMFPAPGEKRPRRRFKGFSGDWERIKLGNYVSIKSETSKDLHLPNVEYEDIISGEGRLNKNIYLKNAHKYGKLFKKGDVLYGKLRPYLKNWLLPDFDGIAVGDFWVLHSYTIESQFLYVLIQSEEFMRIANLSIGTKMPRADWNLISQSEFYIPSDTEEQKGIGKFFCDIDLKILHVEEKLQKIILVKQAYLSELFV